jgi:diaminohydroxyphosphoribosylaminopyrimidine deaminase / 5-amino-6-(5-phosphoribosylamino)uracil reductase
MVGVGTVLADDPLLTSRSAKREPMRVVLDSHGRTPLEARLLRSLGGQVLLLVGMQVPEAKKEALRARGAEVWGLPLGADGRVDLDAALRALRRRGCRRLLVEGGPTLHGALFDQGRVDYVHWFIAPRILGGLAAPGAVAGEGRARLAEAPRLRELRVESLGTELFVSGRVSA